MIKTLASFCLTGLLSLPAAAASSYVEQTNGFGLSVFNELVTKEESSNKNILYSPLGINSALSMVGHFAAPEAQEALLSAMGVQMSFSEYNAETQSLYQSINDAQNDRYDVNIANSFWVDEQYRVEDTNRAVQNLRTVYDATMNNSVLFANSSTADAMNAWVAEATDDKITNLVTADEVSTLQWASINAILLDAKWYNKLGASSRSPFTAADGSENEVLYMEANDGVQTLEKENMVVWEVAYGDRDNKKGSFIILQPKNPADLSKVVADLTAQNLAQIKTDLDEQSALGNFPYVNLRIPAFELDYETGMDEIASLMANGGASSYFSGFDMTSLHASFNADRMNKIKVIKQKAVITVANEGTVAAAASFVGGGIESMGPRTVSVNSAFAYAIMDEATGAVLFLGTLNDASTVKTPEMK